MATIRITSSDRMSNTQYHRTGQPHWWARVGEGESAQWLDIGRVRGDEVLDVSIQIERHPTESIIIHYGVGSRDRGVRKTFRVLSAAEVAARAAAKVAAE